MYGWFLSLRTLLGSALGEEEKGTVSGAARTVTGRHRVAMGPAVGEWGEGAGCSSSCP